MPEFELKYNSEVSYSEKVVLEIKLKTKPEGEDYKNLIDALDTFAKKYLTIKAGV